MAKGKAKAAGVHLIAGTDPRLAEEALEDLLAAALGDRRDGRAGGASAATRRPGRASWTWPRTGSLFAPRRAVVVRDADALKGDGEEMLAYLDDPTPSWR